jgi:hypothetical protein
VLLAVNIEGFASGACFYTAVVATCTYNLV